MLHHAVHEHFDDDLPMNRRGFLRGLTGFLAAPAIVRVSALMPVREFDDGWVDGGNGIITPASIADEMCDVIRRAFVPRVFVQIL